MEIRINEGVLLEQIPSHKLLGVEIDQELLFNDHVEDVCAESLPSVQELLDM